MGGRSDKRKDINALLVEKNDIAKKVEDFKSTIEESKQGAEVYRSYFDEEDKLENVNRRIAELTADKNAELINNHFSMINSDEGGFSLPKMYGLKR